MDGRGRGDQAEAALVITPHATDSADNDADTAPVTFRVVRRPTIASISPTSGPANGGIEIVVTGENFVVPSTEPGAESDGSHLLLDGVALTITSIGPTEIHAELPKHDPGVGQFSVANGDAETPSKLPFDFIGPPIVKLVSPLKGPVTGGTHVFISGNGFRNGDTTVTIGDAPLASLMSHGALMIDGYVPPVDAPGPVPIVVTVGAFATTYYAPFVYEAAIADPPDGGADPVGFTGAK